MYPLSLASITSNVQSNSAKLFLHLSDIHFRNGVSDDPYDLDVDLRRQLEIDAVRFLAEKQLDKVTGILVTGDIAFGGDEREYTIAKDWLNTLAGELRCHPKVILTTPGNHDIDRRIYSRP